jgi:phage-related protein
VLQQDDFSEEQLLPMQRHIQQQDMENLSTIGETILEKNDSIYLITRSIYFLLISSKFLLILNFRNIFLASIFVITIVFIIWLK